MSIEFMAEVRGRSPKPLRYGVELEAEYAHHVHVPPATGWITTTDGSLRNEGREFVFDGPVGYEGAIDRINALGACIAEADEQPIHNARTSVHIHVDVSGMKPAQFNQFVRSWACIEPALFDKYGRGREYSPYCVPLYQGRAYLYRLLMACDSDAEHASFTLRNFKYTALSCNRFRDLGTMEARLFNGTNDPNVLIEYLTVVNMLANGCSVEDVLTFMGSLDYLEQAQDIDKLIDFERALPVVTQWPRRGERDIVNLYRRDGVRMSVGKPEGRKQRGGGSAGQLHRQMLHDWLQAAPPTQFTSHNIEIDGE